MNIKKLYKLLLIGLTVSLNTNTHAMYYPMKAARIVHSLYAMNIRTLYKIGSLFSKKPTTESIPTEKDTHEELSQHHAKTKKHTLNKIKFDRGSSYLFKCVNYYLSKYKQKGFNGRIIRGDNDLVMVLGKANKKWELISAYDSKTPFTTWSPEFKYS